MVIIFYCALISKGLGEKYDKVLPILLENIDDTCLHCILDTFGPKIKYSIADLVCTT